MIEEKYSASIIIPAYNNEMELEYTLQAILRSDYDMNDIEVLVCDDGSEKPLIKTVKKYEKILNIRYFYQPDKGFRAAAARNMGILNAKGKICIFLDSGVMPSTGCISAHINAHKNEHTAVIGYVYGFDNENKSRETILELLDVNDIDKSIKLMKNESILDIREAFYKDLGYDLSMWPAPWCYFWSCNISVDRSDLVEFALFDESFVEWGGEDLDLGIALHIHKENFVLRRDADAIHYPHEKRNHLIENPELFMKNLEATRKKLYQKYLLPEIMIWIKLADTRKLNQYLIEHPDEWK